MRRDRRRVTLATERMRCKTCWRPEHLAFWPRLDRVRRNFPSPVPVPRHQDGRADGQSETRKGKPLAETTRASIVRVGVISPSRCGDLRGGVPAAHALRAGEDGAAAGGDGDPPHALRLEGGAHGLINRIRDVLTEAGPAPAACCSDRVRVARWGFEPHQPRRNWTTGEIPVKAPHLHYSTRKL